MSYEDKGDDIVTGTIDHDLHDACVTGKQNTLRLQMVVVPHKTAESVVPTAGSETADKPAAHIETIDLRQNLQP